MPERKLVSLETSLRKQSSYMGTYFYLYFFLETAWLFSQAKSWWCIWPFFWFTNWDKLKLTITDIVKSWSLCGIHPSFFFQLASCHRLRGGVYLRQVASLFQCCGFAVLKKLSWLFLFYTTQPLHLKLQRDFPQPCVSSLYMFKNTTTSWDVTITFFLSALCASANTRSLHCFHAHTSVTSPSLYSSNISRSLQVYTRP